MRIGVLSDTHDNLKNVDAAVRLFAEAAVEFVFHCGDFVAPFTVSRMGKLHCPWKGVFGNNDGEKRGLEEKSRGRIRKAPLRARMGGNSIVVVHDLSGLSLKDDDPATVVLHGHTHRASVRKISGRLLVNPGECGGWLYGKPSVAIVDLAVPSAEIRFLTT